MIDNLETALSLMDRYRESEVVVSEKVLLEVLQALCCHGDGRAQLNIRQADSKYLLHRISWKGRLFIHLSRGRLMDTPVMADSFEGSET
jgi:hypothetical protein